MKFFKIALMSTALAFAPAAIAQETDAPATQTVSVGTTIYGNDGNPVGTVEQIADGIAEINTGEYVARIPAELIGAGEQGPSVNATREQINSMVAAQQAELEARRDSAMVEGAAVESANGEVAGTLTQVDLAANAIILTSAAGPVALKKENFALDAEGRLRVLYSREDIETAAAAASGGGASGASD
jgi:hypothetical protein